MFDFLKKKTGSRLGLDIGTSTLKMVETNQEADGWHLKNYAFLDLFLSSRGSALARCEATDIMSEQSLASLIKSFLKKGNFSSREVVVSVPVFSSFFTAISLPAMSESELESAIRYEAKKYVPLPLEEFELDWLISAPQSLASGSEAATGLKSGARLDILLVAVPKEIVQRLSRIVASLDLKLVALEAENFSLIRALQGQINQLTQELKTKMVAAKQDVRNVKSNCLILDAGARSTNLIWLQNNLVRLVYFIDYSGNRITNFLAEQTHLGFGEIEEMKRARGLIGNNLLGDRDEAVVQNSFSQLKPAFKKVVNEIKAVIGSAQAGTIIKGQLLDPPYFCLLSGGSANLTVFQDYLKQNLDIPIFMADPFIGLTTPNNLGDCLKDLGPSMSVAVGLAMR